MMNSLLTTLRGDFTNTKKCGRQILDKNWTNKREKTNLFYPYAMGLFCELKGKFVYSSQTSSWGNIPMLRIFLRAQRQAWCDATLNKVSLKSTATGWPRNVHQAPSWRKEKIAWRFLERWKVLRLITISSQKKSRT